MKFSEFISNYFIDDSSYIVGYNAEANVNIKIPILTLISVLSNVTGTGTENMGVKWSGPQTLTNSSFFDNGNLIKTIQNGITTKGLYIDFANSTYKLGNGGNNGLVILPSNKAVFSSSVTATEIIKLGGLSTEFLKADGSVDTNTYQQQITLTTTGTSGAATLIGNTLNIPIYGGGVPEGVVLSVNSQLPDIDGNVSLTTSNVPEGANKYFTDSRARNSLSSSATGLTYTSETGVFSLTTGYAIPTTTEINTWNDMVAGSVTLDTAQTITGIKTFGADGGSGYVLFPNTVSGFENKIQTEYGSNAFSIYGAGSQIRFTQNDIQVGTSAYVNVSKGTHTATIATNFTERFKIEGAGPVNKTQFLNTRVLINDTVDDGSAVLQVSGNEKLKGNMIFDNSTRQIYWGDSGTSILFVGDEMNFANWYGYFRFKKSSTSETQFWVDLFGNTRTRGYFGPVSTLANTTVSGSNGESGSAGTKLILQGGTSGVGPVYAGGNGGDIIIKNGLATDNSSGFGGIAGNIIFQYGNYNTDGWSEFGRINKVGRFLIGSPSDNGLAQVQMSGAIYVGTIANIASDTDKFLMSDGGVIKYVTGATLATYIGAVTDADIIVSATVVPNTVDSSGAIDTTINLNQTDGGVIPIELTQSFRHIQSSNSTSWVVTHNLGYRPSVTIIDIDGDVVNGDIVYNTLNQLTLNFSTAIKGEAYLN